MKNFVLLLCLFLGNSPGLRAELAYEEAISLNDGSSILHTKAPTEREGEFHHRVMFVEESGEKLLIWEQEFKGRQGNFTYAQLERLVTSTRKNQHIRVITDWNAGHYGIWNLEIIDKKVVMHPGAILQFLEGRKGIKAIKESYTLGVLDKDEVMKNKAVLARGITEAQRIIFSNFDTIEVLWVDGSKDIVEMSPDGMISSVSNAKEKIPAIDGVTREWQPGPSVRLNPSNVPDYESPNTPETILAASKQAEGKADLSTQDKPVQVLATNKKPEPEAEPKSFPWIWISAIAVIMGMVTFLVFQLKRA